MSIINETCIGLKLEAASARDGIIRAGRVLLDEGHIRPEYIEAMLRNYEKNGPYFAIAPGFSMPHARPEDGVIRSGISLITLRNPVYFGSANDPVKVIMALATGSDNEHLEIMAKIAALLSQGDVVEALWQCQTTPEALAILNKDSVK